MKKFVIPEVEVLRFHVEDILTTSYGDETPILPISGISAVSEDECAKISID